MSKEDFLKGLKTLQLAYNKDFTEEQTELWYEMLGQYSLKEFSEAIQELILKEEYMPSIATITKHIAKKHLKDVPDAETEWNNVIASVHGFGSYREKEALNSMNEYTAKIVRLIGYQRICMATPEEQVWNKKEFIGEYNSLIDKLEDHLRLDIKDGNYLNG